MFRLVLLLCAAMFVVMLIGGRDDGQVRYGLIPGKIAPLRPEKLPEPPVVAAVAPVETEAAEVIAVSAPVAAAVTVEASAPLATAAAVDPQVVEGVETGLTLALPLVEPGTELPEEEADVVAEPVAVVEPVPEPEVQYVVGTAVNVRSGPSAETEALAKLGRGEAVLVMPSDTPGWSRIRIEGDGVEGYIASRFLSGTPETSLFDTAD